MLIQYLRRPVRFDYLDRWLRNRSVKILDVGCGNHSPSITKKYYPFSIYYGLNKTRDYNLNQEDFNVMDHFYEIDLSDIDKLGSIPNNFFDCVISSHIIEHLRNSEEVISNLLHKLEKGGLIYLEFPSLHSVNLPSMRGTLNFYDDLTHIKLHNPEEVELFLREKGCTIIKSRIRRSLKHILLLPLYLISSLRRSGYIEASIFWDITGYANYIIALKT